MVEQEILLSFFSRESISIIPADYRYNITHDKVIKNYLGEGESVSPSFRRCGSQVPTTSLQCLSIPHPKTDGVSVYELLKSRRVSPEFYARLGWYVRKLSLSCV